MSIRLRILATGALSYVPGVMPLYRRAAFRPNAAPAESSYGVWLKHLVFSRPYRPNAIPKTVVELGPGMSLGFGLAALICGAERYIALDAVRFAQMSQVLSVFDSLVRLFMRRERPSNVAGFPSFEFSLDASGFPAQDLPRDQLAHLLNAERIAELRADLERFVASGGRRSDRITYIAPWRLDDVPFRGEVDLLCSHSVLEHVHSLQAVWADVAQLLCRGGVCTHQINFDSHGTSAIWNGHWAYPDELWRLALGKKTFLINREPLSHHLVAAERSGLTLVMAKTRQDRSGIERHAMAARWQRLSDDDAATRGALLVARKS